MVAAASTLIMGQPVGSHVEEEYLFELLRGLANNVPDFIEDISGDAEEASLLKNGFLQPVFKVKIDRRIYTRWLFPFCAKLGLAFWYRENKAVFPQVGAMAVAWFTNQQIADGAVDEEFLSHFPSADFPRQGKLKHDKQFYYRFARSKDEKLAAFLFVFHMSSAAWVIMSSEREGIDRYRGRMCVYRTSAEEGIFSSSMPIDFHV